MGEVRKVVHKSLSKEQRDALKRDKDLFAEVFEDLTKEQQDQLEQWEKKILESSLEPFQGLLKTVWNWLPEILNRFIYRISNAKTEGKNNQVRTMNQQGFGYSLNSLQARMQIKEEKTAQLKWREYQDRYERRLKQNESQTA